MHWEQEVCEWVYAFWKCKPVVRAIPFKCVQRGPGENNFDTPPTPTISIFSRPLSPLFQFFTGPPTPLFQLILRPPLHWFFLLVPPALHQFFFSLLHPSTLISTTNQSSIYHERSSVLAFLCRDCSFSSLSKMCFFKLPKIYTLQKMFSPIFRKMIFSKQGEIKFAKCSLYYDLTDFFAVDKNQCKT